MLPYNVNIDVLFKVVDELRTAGQGGEKKAVVWQHIGQDKKASYSYVFNMAKALGFIEDDYTTAKITSFGKSVGFLSGEKKNETLARNLPALYNTILKWVYYSDAKELETNDIKSRLSSSGITLPDSVLDAGVGTFAHYCERLGILRYIGRGKGTKVVLTDFGKRIFGSSTTDMSAQDNKSEEVDTSRSGDTPQQKQGIAVAGEYVVRIITPDRDFVWDIRAISDLPQFKAILDATEKAIEEDWKRKHQNNTENHAD